MQNLNWDRDERSMISACRADETLQLFHGPVQSYQEFMAYKAKDLCSQTHHCDRITGWFSRCYLIGRSGSHARVSQIWWSAGEGFSFWKDMPHLISISLQNSTSISDLGLVALARLQPLRSLNLKGCREITDAGMQAMSSLQRMTFLRIQVILYKYPIMRSQNAHGGNAASEILLSCYQIWQYVEIAAQQQRSLASGSLHSCLIQW